MQEILTPIQYEPALDMLNQINKLSISDKAALSIDAMQACKNPVGHGNPIIGKFCKEDQNGALVCKHLVKERTNFEQRIIQMVIAPTWGSITYSQKVYGVVAISFVYNPPTDWNMWCTNNRQKILQLEFFQLTYLPFEGETIWFSTRGIGYRGSVLTWGYY